MITKESTITALLIFIFALLSITRDQDPVQPTVFEPELHTNILELKNGEGKLASDIFKELYKLNSNSKKYDSLATIVFDTYQEEIDHYGWSDRLLSYKKREVIRSHKESEQLLASFRGSKDPALRRKDNNNQFTPGETGDDKSWINRYGEAGWLRFQAIDCYDPVPVFMVALV